MGDGAFCVMMTDPLRPVFASLAVISQVPLVLDAMYATVTWPETSVVPEDGLSLPPVSVFPRVKLTASPWSVARSRAEGLPVGPTDEWAGPVTADEVRRLCGRRLQLADAGGLRVDDVEVGVRARISGPFFSGAARITAVERDSRDHQPNLVFE